MNIPQLKPMVVGTDVTGSGELAFVLMGMAKKGKVYILDEFYRKQPESISHVEALESLIEWLKDSKERYFDQIPPGSEGNKNYLQPWWIVSRSDEFAEYHHYNSTYSIRFAPMPEEEVLQQGANYVQNMMTYDRLEVLGDRCPNLVEEADSLIEGNLKDPSPIISSFLGATKVLMDYRGERMEKNARPKNKDMSNKELIKEFFGR